MTSPPLPMTAPPRRNPVVAVAGAVFNRQTLPTWATVLVCALIYAYAASTEFGFTDALTTISTVANPAYWGVATVGMTLVILAGGIDLSVGSVIAAATVVVAVLVEHHHWHPLLAIPLVLVLGTLFGAGQGVLIHFFNIPAFLTTLGGLFLARGLAAVIAPQPVGISHGFYATLTTLGIPLGHDAYGRAIGLPIQLIVLIVVMAVGFVIARFTRFGRSAYAVGGSEPSAILMGLPVAATKVGVYAVSGFCAALGGVVYTFDTASGNADYAVGQELDVIAAVVVGGTALTGGRGSMVGTLFGFLTFAVMRAAFVYHGNIDPAWTRLAVGVLLLAFILLQKLIARRGRPRAT